MNNKKVWFFLLAFVVVFTGVVTTSVKETKAAVKMNNPRVHSGTQDTESFNVDAVGTGENLLSLSDVSIASQISISGQVIWSDNDNQDGERPSSVTINLFADGVCIASKVVSEVNNWQYTFENIPDQKNGYPIDYQISEDVIKNYSSSYNNYDITNTYRPGNTTRRVIVGWDDEYNYDGIRPSYLIVQLYVDGQPSGGGCMLNAFNNWSYIWENLPVLKAGKPMVYSVQVLNKPTEYIEKQSDYNGTSVFVYQHIPEVSTTATLHYDANTGNTATLPTDGMDTFQSSETGSITVSDAVPTKAADAYYTYTFKEWNTQADGLGTAYLAGDEIDNLVGGSTTTLYAQWNKTAIPPVSATLNYNANGGDNTSLPLDETTTFQPSETRMLTVSNTTPTKTADDMYTYTFKEWNAKVDGSGTPYVAGDTISVVGGDSITLYAIWDEDLKSTRIVTHYVDVDGNTIADDEITTNTIGSEYTTTELSGEELVNGDIAYILTKTPDNASGTYGVTDIEVTYVYSLSKSIVPDPIVSSSVTVRHVDQNGIIIAADVVMVGEVGHIYTTSALSGKALVIGDTTYELSEVPDNANGVYGMSNIVVTYVYTIVDDKVEAPIEKPSITPSIPKVEEPIKKPSIAPSAPATEISKGYPDTGDTTDVSMLLAFMVVSGLVIGLLRKKKTV